MRCRVWFIASLVVSSLLVLATTSAPARAGKVKLAVLGVESKDEDPQTQEQTTRIAGWLTAELRLRASQARARFEIPANSNKDLAEVKLLSSCLDENKRCMAQIGKDMGAEKLMYGQVEKRNNGYFVSLRVLNVAAGEMDKQKPNTPLTDLSEPAVRGVAGALFGELMGIPTVGKLAVEANAEKGTVSVNGVPKKDLVGGRAVLDDLPEGKIEVSISADGYKDYDTSVVIHAGETEKLKANLQHEDKPFIPPDGGGGGEGGGGGGDGGDGGGRPGGTYRSLTWVFGGATVLFAGGFTFTAMKFQGYQDDHDTLVGTRDVPARAWETAYQKDPARLGDSCSEADRLVSHGTRTDDPSFLLTGDDVTRAKDVQTACDGGKKYAPLTWATGIGAGVFAVATVYVLYKGYISPGPVEKPPGEARRRKPAAPSFVVLPEVYPGGGAGVGAVLQF